MTTFDKRQEGFEKKFALDEEQKFKAEARRNRMLGLWAAEKLGTMRRSFKRLGRLLMWPIISILAKVDRIPPEFHEGQMITGLWGMAWK
jgi:Uncharacterized conserved protein